jgi:hypothetical protein
VLEWIVEGITLKAGQLLDITVLGIGIRVPPWDITIWRGTKLLAEDAFNLVLGMLDKLAEEYYAREEEEA